MTLTVRPLTAVIGAEIGGVDLRRPLDPATLAEIRQALLDHLVLFFRDQDISVEDHLRFSEYFGPVIVGKGRRPGDPALAVNRIEQIAPKGHGTDTWHSDHMFLPEPPFGTVLRAAQLPSVGGDTCFMSMYAAYEALSPSMQAFLETLTATNSAEPVVRRVKDLGIYTNDIAKEMHAPVVHPVVHRHPETGRKALYVCGNYTTRINELSEAESDALLQMLFAHNESAHFQCRFHWEVNSLALWDNRVTQHLAIPDYRETRVMYRSMIAGSAPIPAAA